MKIIGLINWHGYSIGVDNEEMLGGIYDRQLGEKK